MKKIMFNDKYGLTEAVLDGRKNQTRRIEGSNGSKTRYEIGEIVSIAQSYKTITDNSQTDKVYAEKSYEINKHFKDYFVKESVWTNKMFSRPELMPYRIKITGIRREKLNDISNADCFAEGVCEHNDKYFVPAIGKYFDTPKKAYADLIDKVGHKGDWDRNPEVVAYEFKLID